MNKGGRPPGTKNKKPEGVEQNQGGGTSLGISAQRRPLPKDPAERDNALAPYKFFTRPLVGCMSRFYKYAGLEPLDRDEREGGTEAFAAVAYEYMEQMDSRFLLLIWLTSTAAPRLLDYFDKKEAEENAQKPEAINKLAAEKRENRPVGGPLVPVQ